MNIQLESEKWNRLKIGTLNKGAHGNFRINAIVRERMKRKRRLKGQNDFLGDHHTEVMPEVLVEGL